MKKFFSKVLLFVAMGWILTLSLAIAASPQSGAPWVVSASLYPDKKSAMPQVDYTREYRHINLPEFWIDRLRYPDREIMGIQQIEQFNAQTAHLKKLTYPPQDFNTSYSGDWVGDKLARQFAFLAIRAFYLENGRPIDKRILPSLWQNCAFDTIPETITARYALVVRYANHRLSPSAQTLLKKPGQRYFDRNQNAALDIGTPLAILHQSADKKWYFSLSSSSYGWIAAEDIAFATREEMLRFSRSRNFITTINPKNALFIKGRYENFVRMGVRLPYIGKLGEKAEVQIPARDSDGNLTLQSAELQTSDIHLGYLPYTPRTIIRQAFKFLNAPYGWGGMFGEQDCSKFLQQIYSTVGILLPRNSGDQELAGKPLVRFDSNTKARIKTLIERGEPGTTLLHLPGHIMLYLGSYKGAPYMIHTVWGAVKGKNPIAKTAVTSVFFKHYIDKMDTAITIEP